MNDENLQKNYKKVSKSETDENLNQETTNISNLINLNSEEINFEISDSEENIIENNNQVISYKEELLKGNFMPAIILLEKKKLMSMMK